MTSRTSARYRLALLSLGLLSLLQLTSIPTWAQSEPQAGRSAQADKENDFEFIDNGRIRLGVKPSSGAAIAWLSLSGSDQNLVNHFDRGRLIQQSYYGDSDGSLWAKQPWRWNPVQGGHYKGEGAPVAELSAKATELYSRSTPRHWATGELLSDCTMEQTIKLLDSVAHVHFRFEYKGTKTHSAQHQEIPAIFLEPQYKHLVHYAGDAPWRVGGLDPSLARSVPGWPNESRKITEHWAAFVDENEFGLGAYVPVAKEITCYRYADGDRSKGACSYFAPLAHFAVTPGLVWEYDLYLTVGPLAEIRDRFHQIERRSATK